MTQRPANLRVALKDDDMHILVPGELATPFKRSGYEIESYIPVSALLSDEVVEAARIGSGVRGRLTAENMRKALQAAIEQVGGQP